MISHGIISASATAKGNTDEILRRLKLRNPKNGHWEDTSERDFACDPGARL
jgi:hypothetical protein